MCTYLVTIFTVIKTIKNEFTACETKIITVFSQEFLYSTMEINIALVSEKYSTMVENIAPWYYGA